MQEQKLYIKGMVCDRCILSVKEAIESLGIQVTEARLGEVALASGVALGESLIEQRLQPLGFSLLKDKKQQLVKDVKALVAEVYSRSFDFTSHFRFSHFAEERLNVSYDAISNTFSSIEETTLEKYIIDFRIEKIKEALVCTESSLSDIAFALGFSSVAHLSKQFKLYTGLNPSYFREIKNTREKRKSQALDD
jgi:AraC family transcriptional regulator